MKTLVFLLEVKVTERNFRLHKGKGRKVNIGGDKSIGTFFDKPIAWVGGGYAEENPILAEVLQRFQAKES